MNKHICSCNGLKKTGQEHPSYKHPSRTIHRKEGIYTFRVLFLWLTNTYAVWLQNFIFNLTRKIWSVLLKPANPYILDVKSDITVTKGYISWRLEKCHFFSKANADNQPRPQGFSLKNGWGRHPFLREKPWGRGWLTTTNRYFSAREWRTRKNWNSLRSRRVELINRDGSAMEIPSCYRLQIIIIMMIMTMIMIINDNN